MANRLKAYAALTAVSAIWGVAAVVIKFTLKYYQPFTFLSYRFWVSFLLVLPFFIIEYRKHQPTFKQMKETVVLTFIGIPLNLILVFIGINMSTALEASFIMSTAPLYSVIGGYFFLHEKISRHELIGIILASLGALIIVTVPMFESSKFKLVNLEGNLILVLSLLALGYYTVRSRSDLNHKFSPWFITVIGFMVAPIVTTPLALLEQPASDFPQAILNQPLSAHLGVWYMAILSGIIAYFMFQWGLSKIEASEASIFQYLGPIFAAPLAVLWLEEKITLPFVIGATVTIIGVTVAEYHGRVRRRRQKKLMAVN